MASAETARLVAELTLRDKQFTSGLDRLDKGISRLGVKTTALGTGIGVGVERLAEKGIGALFGAIQSGQEHLHELQDLQAQTGAVIASTGGKAGISAEQVRDYASALEDLTTADDKQIQNAENLLLTFTGIGKGVFPDATKAVVNMGIAFAGGDAAAADFSASAIQVGKALNDPIKGITALSKVGVSFTEKQKEQIKTLVKAGKVQEAQKVILAELATEFGKAGEAAGTTGAAGARRLNDAVEDLQVSLAEGLDPALTEIRDELGRALKDPAVQKAVRDLGKFLGEAAKNGLKFAQDIPWGTVADGLRTAAGFAKDVVNAFTSLPPEAQATIIALAGLNKLSGGAITKSVGGIIGAAVKGIGGALFEKGGSPANPLFVFQTNPAAGGGPSIPGGAPAAAAGGLTAGAVVTTGAVAGILGGGLIVSLNSIADEAGKNNLLAQKGLTQDEIIAQKYYNANKADQDRIFKQLHGIIPPKSVFESGNAKLQKAVDTAARNADQAQALVHATERAEANRASQTAKVIAKIGDGTSEAKASAVKTQSDIQGAAGRQYAATQAARAAVQSASAKAAVDAALTRGKVADTASETRGVAAAVRAKKLAITNKTYVDVNTNVSVRETIKGQTTFKQYSKVIAS